jgi:hypothetical protein
MNHEPQIPSVVNTSLQVDNSSLNQTKLEKQPNKNKINISNRGMQRQHLKNIYLLPYTLKSNSRIGNDLMVSYKLSRHIFPKTI